MYVKRQICPFNIIVTDKNGKYLFVEQLKSHRQEKAVMPRVHHRIDYVEFPATDIPATKQFYSEVFGWKFTDYGPDYVAFVDGQLDGGFAKVKSPVSGGPLIIFYSSRLEETQSAVLAHGGKISKKIFSFPGGRRFHFLDPNANELAVWSE